MTSYSSSNVMKRRRFSIFYWSIASANSATSGREERLPSRNCRRSTPFELSPPCRLSTKSGLLTAVCCWSMKPALLRPRT